MTVLKAVIFYAPSVKRRKEIVFEEAAPLTASELSSSQYKQAITLATYPKLYVNVTT